MSSNIASCAPEVGEARFAARVLTAACPVKADGRPMHYFRMIDSTWLCECGESLGGCR